MSGERSGPVFSGAAGGHFSKFKAKMVNFNTGLSTGKIKVVKNLELCLEMWLGHAQLDGKALGPHQAC